MQTHCRCGQVFTLPDERFPHRVSCHVCGRRFLVHENGAIEAITNEPVTALCRCGKSYVVRCGPFPRDLHCLECNRKFSVLSTGEIIDLQEEPSVAAAGVVKQALAPSLPATGIQTEATRLATVGDPESIIDEHTKNLLDDAAGLPNADRLERELEAIDLEWEAEQYQARAMRLFGHLLFTSPTFVLGLGMFTLLLLIVPALMLILALKLGRHTPFEAFVAHAALIVVAYVQVLIVVKSVGWARLKKARRTWQRKRQEAIAKYSPWAHLLPTADADGPSD